MIFQLSEEQAAFRDSVRRLAQDKLAEDALERSRTAEFPVDLARMLASHGLLGITLPVEDGGQGGTLMDAVIAIQTLAEACPKSADVVQAGNFGPIRTFAAFASDVLKSKYLPGLLAGDNVIALGMSEPEAGSAVTDLKTVARRVDGGVRITGSKVFSTYSSDAELFLVYVRFDEGVEGIGSVVVERDSPGVVVGTPSTFMSGEKWSQLYFDDCFVPEENILLGKGGFKRQIAGFNVERVGNSARSLAVGRHAFEIAREHVLTRKQFGRPLAEFQGLRWQFAEVAVKMAAAQLLLYQAATNADSGFPSAYETSCAKLACNQAGFDAANLAVQAMGGYGYSQESIVEYCFRRTRGWMIAGGSTEILKDRISEEVFGRRFNPRAR